MTDIPIALFFITSLLLIATPGQDMILIMSRSVAQGSKAGVLTAAGVSTGLLGHTVLTALGLGVILQASEALFIGLKIVGAVYLIYLGIKTYKEPPVDVQLLGQFANSSRSLFVQGALSNLSNPKIAIFYFAFLPQFVATGTENTTMTLLLLGSVFSLLTFLVKGPVGYIAGALSGWLRSCPGIQVWLNRISGVVLVGLGIRLAFENRNG